MSRPFGKRDLADMERKLSVALDRFEETGVVALDLPRGEIFYMLHPSTTDPGAWRVTEFGHDGPIGHTEAATKEDAVRASFPFWKAAEARAVTEEEFLAVQQSPEFREGEKRVEFVRIANQLDDFPRADARDDYRQAQELFARGEHDTAIDELRRILREEREAEEGRRAERERHKEEVGLPLYHVTWWLRLDEIAAEGLLADARGGVGIGGYASHSYGRTFLTEADGLSFWIDRFQDHAFDRSEAPWEEGLIPVVLRVNYVGEVVDDEAGTRDARAEAFYTEEDIPPDELEIWTGSRWAPLDSWEDELELDEAHDGEGHLDDAAPLFAPAW